MALRDRVPATHLHLTPLADNAVVVDIPGSGGPSRDPFIAVPDRHDRRCAIRAIRASMRRSSCVRDAAEVVCRMCLATTRPWGCPALPHGREAGPMIEHPWFTHPAST